MTAERNGPVGRVWTLALLIASTVFFSSGCAYFKNRGNDAMDFLDVGVTVSDSWKPSFRCYFDMFVVTPIGFAATDCNFYGLSHRRFGKMDIRDHSWGVLLLGKERRGIGEFDASNPYHARQDQSDLTDWPTYKVGVVGLIAKPDPPPWRQFFEGKRGLHLGWVGIDLTCRINEMVDFLLGWTSLDIMSDDEYDRF